MTVRVIHSTVTGAASDLTALVDGPKWDADHTVTGLENVDNTSDVNKPVSTATQTALDLKANAASPVLTGNATLASGTLAAGAMALSLTATQPASPASVQNAIAWTITSDGSASQTNRGFLLSYAAGYTGSSATQGMAIGNSTASTGTTLVAAAGTNGVGGNAAFQANASGTTVGLNVGVSGIAANGNTNVGLFGGAQIAKNSATNIGVAGTAINTGTTPVHVGGWFSLNQTTVPTVSAALIADNSAQSDPVARFRVAGVDKVLITAAGTVDVNSSGLTIATPDALNPGVRILAATNLPSSVYFQNYGTSTNLFRAYQAGGTTAVPAGLTAGSQMFNISAIGFDSSLAWGAGASARIVMNAFNAHTGTDHSSYMTFSTTPSGSATIAVGMQLQPSGGVSIGATAIASDPGIGNLSVSNAIQFGSFTVATLPTGVTGRQVYCSNCRVYNGAGVQEGVGVGTGGMVSYNSTAWKIVGTNVTAVA